AIHQTPIQASAMPDPLYSQCSVTSLDHDWFWLGGAPTASCLIYSIDRLSNHPRSGMELDFSVYWQHGLDWATETKYLPPYPLLLWYCLPINNCRLVFGCLRCLSNNDNLPIYWFIRCSSRDTTSGNPISTTGQFQGRV
ncbi:hypothetical protein AVDCRST_MAG81-1687, partial [uncultured Synechococcales cyanobacterium]